MTGAAGITPSSVTPPNGLGTKRSSSMLEEDDAHDLPELPIFSEYFSDLEQREAIPDAMPKEEPPVAVKPEMPQIAGLQVEATHNEWFGDTLPDETTIAETEPFVTRQAPFFLHRSEAAVNHDVKAAPVPASPVEMQDELSSQLPLSPQADLALISDDQPVEAAHSILPMSQPANMAEAAASENSSRPTTQIRGVPGWFPGQHAVKDAEAVKPNAGHVSMASNSAQPGVEADNITARQQITAMQQAVAGELPKRDAAGQPPLQHNQNNSGSDNSSSANVRASLSALQAVLSGDSAQAVQPSANTGNAGADAQSRDPNMQQMIREAGISAIRHETHMQPGFSQSPVLQIAQRVAHEVQNLKQTADSTAQTQPARPPMRVLHIQLTPPQLGPLTIRLSLRNDALMVQLETANFETARMIHKDREALSGLLRSAGYALDTMNIHVSSVERGVGGQPFSSSQDFGQALEQQGSGDRASGQSGQRRQQAGTGEGDAVSGGQQGNVDEPNHLRNGVYL